MGYWKSILFVNTLNHKWSSFGAVSHRFNWISYTQLLTTAAAGSKRGMKTGLPSCVNQEIKKDGMKTEEEMELKKDKELSNNNMVPDDQKRMKSDNRKCYSHMYLSGRYASLMRAVVVPKIDLILQDVLDGNNKNHVSLQRRLKMSNGEYILSDDHHYKFNLHQLKAQVEQLIELRKKLKALRDEYMRLKRETEAVEVKSKGRTEEPLSSDTSDDDEEWRTLANTVWDMEDKVMPIILNLPNDLREDVPEGWDVRVIKSIEPRRKPFKILDSQRLAYVNQTIYNSIIGPSPYYLYQKGAQLHHSIINLFSQSLRKSGFVDFTGLDFVKSAIVEACNDVGSRNPVNDALRIAHGSKSRPDTQQTHFVGDASLEAICSFIVSSFKDSSLKVEHPLRYFSIGASYDQNLRQANVIQCLSVTKDNDTSSNEEMDNIANIIWSLYSALEIPCRLINCGDKLLNSQEFARYSLELWIPSSRAWSSVARISHYRHFIARRLGLENVHLIDAVVLDSKSVIAAMMENNQTESGSFDIPKALKV